MRDLEIYIHIPFCARKCNYCDFLSFWAETDVRDRYVRDLITEINHGLPVGAPCDNLMKCDKNEYIVTSVYFGGGTPSLLCAGQIAGIMKALRSVFRFKSPDDTEITIECNPGTFDMEFSPKTRQGKIASKPEIFRECGINRISFGLQSADDKELAALGRIHTWDVFMKSYKEARDAGFRNINIDLMSAIPGQNRDSWETTLRKVIALNPEHISAYSLIIEEGTPFYARYHEDDIRRERGEKPLFLPSEEEEREMYALTGELLGGAGMHRYEISNYALPGYECRHNTGYWTGTEYMGFGLGASSMLKYIKEGELISIRSKNPDDLIRYETEVNEREQAYSETPQGSKEMNYEILTKEDEMEEFMFLGLRMTAGVSEQEFALRFGRPIDEVYGTVIDKYCKLGLLKRENERIALTDPGFDLSNTVMAEFLL